MVSGTPFAVVVEVPKLDRMSSRTIPLWFRTFGPFEPSPGHGRGLVAWCRPSDTGWGERPRVSSSRPCSSMTVGAGRARVGARRQTGAAPDAPPSPETRGLQRAIARACRRSDPERDHDGTDE